MVNATSHRSGDDGGGSASGDPGSCSIAPALDRLERALDKRPGLGQSSARSTTMLEDGLSCSSRDGDYIIPSDLPSGLGGTASAPTPSMLLRAAVGSCLAMGYRLRAARHRVPITSIEVLVETDSDIAGMLIPDGPARPGFLSLHYHVEIQSSAPPAAVARIVDEADRLSPVLDVVTAGSQPRRTLLINGETL